jgi:16S rRNA (cytosine967-C5)-methyltransferase
MKRAAPARRAACRALRAVTSGRSDLPDALSHAREHLTDARDQSLAAAVVAGTLRWMGAIDAVIAAFGRRPTSRLDPEVLDVLRLGAFQLLHLQRVPASAVIADAVELVREQKKSSACGFVNALLRRVDRERGALPLPARPSAPGGDGWLDYLSITLSHPRWLVERWLAAVGADASERWALFDNEPAPVTLRANPLKVTRDELAARLEAAGVRTTPTRFARDGLVVVEGHPMATPLFAEGQFFVQDEASQLVAAYAGARPGMRVLDACASPGGKAVAMAADMRDQGLVAAGDVRGRRIDLLTETVRRSGAGCVRIVRLDARALPFEGVFDLVLIDAPCSGLGTIRRDPEIRWRREPPDLAAMAVTQRQMLDQAALAVRSGGHLVYATCSSEPDENENVVATFLHDHPEFVPAPPSGDEAVPALTPVLDTSGNLRTRPHLHGLEAFFASRLRRVAATL